MGIIDSFFKTKTVDTEKDLSAVYDLMKNKQEISSTKTFLDIFTNYLNIQNNQNNADKKITKNFDKKVTGINDIVKSISSIDSLKEEIKDRKNSYSMARYINNNIPQLAAGVSIIAENIISPDEIGLNSFQIVEKSSVITDEEKNKRKEEKNKIEDLINEFSINESIYSWISSALINGDYFIELIDLDSVHQGAESKQLTEDNKILLEKNFFSENKKLEGDEKLLYETLSLIEKNITFDGLIESEDKEEKDKKIKMIEKKIFLRTVEPENVIKLEDDGIVYGYIVFKEKKLDKKIQTDVSNNFGNLKINTGSDSRIIDSFLDKIKNVIKIQSNNFSVKDEELRKFLFPIITKGNGLNIRYVPSDRIFHLKRQSSVGNNVYGESLFNSIFFLSKHYLAVLISYTIFLLTRAPEKRLIKVEVGEDMDAASSVQEVIKTLKQKEVSLSSLGTLDALPSALTSFDDIFIPVVNGEQPISIESISGTNNSVDTEYLEVLRKQLVSGIGVPPGLLGETENSYHTSLTQENNRFARTIVRYQSQFIGTFNYMINSIYFLRYGDFIKYNKISFLPPSTIKTEQTAQVISNADTICNFIMDCIGTDTNGVPLVKKIEVARKIAPLIDWEMIDEIVEKVDREKIIKEKLEQGGQAADDSTNVNSDLSQNQ